MLNRMSKYLTQITDFLKCAIKKIDFQTRRKLYCLLFLTILTSCFGLINKYIHRYRTACSFLQKTHRFLKNKEIKISPYRFVPYLHPENSNGRCSGTILTGNTCVSVLVIGGGGFAR